MAIRYCETLSMHIDTARDVLQEATADLAGNPERATVAAWISEVLWAVDSVLYAANLVNCSTPPGWQLPYRYLRRIKPTLLARDIPDAGFAAYQEALSTLRRDTERLLARLMSDEEVPKRMV
jgi:hypothetical protein